MAFNLPHQSSNDDGTRGRICPLTRLTQRFPQASPSSKPLTPGTPAITESLHPRRRVGLFPAASDSTRKSLTRSRGQLTRPPRWRYANAAVARLLVPGHGRGAVAASGGRASRRLVDGPLTTCSLEWVKHCSGNPHRSGGDLHSGDDCHTGTAEQELPIVPGASPRA